MPPYTGDKKISIYIRVLFRNSLTASYWVNTSTHIHSVNSCFRIFRMFKLKWLNTLLFCRKFLPLGVECTRYTVHNKLIDTAVSKLCWQRWSHLYQTVLALRLRNETTRLEKFMHEHKPKWFSVSSNIILRRHEGFIEEIPQKYHILWGKLKDKLSYRSGLIIDQRCFYL